MALNPTTNMFEEITPNLLGDLLRPNGEPVPKHWLVLTMGELVTIKGQTFKVAYIGETAILLEPMKPIILGEED
jgi:hypothetical protein